MPWPIARGLGGSEAVMFGRRVFGADAPRWLGAAYRAFHRMDRAWWGLKYRYQRQHQYHIVRPDVAPGYHDPDAMILECCMTLLGRYIEEIGGVEALECVAAELVAADGGEAESYDGALSDQAKRREEALGIWHWWRVVRPADRKRHDELLDKLYGDGKRMSTVPTKSPQSVEVVFKPFEGAEIVMETELRHLKRRMADDEQAMLHQLIDIRGSLWT
jgi:hypothetical protein